MAEYCSDERKVTTNTSNDAVYMRQERDISMMRTLNLSQLFHGSDPCADPARPTNRKDNLQPLDEPDISSRRISFPPLRGDTPPNSLPPGPPPAGPRPASVPEPSKEKEAVIDEGSLDSLCQPPPEGQKEQVLSQIFAEVAPNYLLKEEFGETREETFPRRAPKESESEDESGNKADGRETGPYLQNESVETVTTEGESREPSWNAMERLPRRPSPPESAAHSKETQDSQQGSGPSLEKRPTLQWAPLPSLESDTEMPTGPDAISSLDSRKVWVPASREAPPSSRVTSEKSSISLDKAVRGKSPAHYFAERETVLRTETKEELDWKEDTPPSFMLPRSGSSLQRGKDKSFHNMVGEIVSQIRDAESGPQSAMVNSINAFVESPVGQLFSATIDRALEKTEEWLNYYLPQPEGGAEPEQVETPVGSDEMCTTSPLEPCKEGCFMRISSLSTQLRSRAFQYVLRHLKSTRQSTGQNLSLLDEVLKMADYSRHLGISNLPAVPGPLGKLWQAKPEPESRPLGPRAAVESITFLPEQLEMKALGLTRNLAQELYTTYHNLLPHVPELPLHLQEKATQVYLNLEELQAHLSKASSMKELPASLALQSRQRIASAKENLDEILDFMAKNPPSQWLQQKSAPKAGINGPLFSPKDKPQAGPSNQAASGPPKGPDPASPPTPPPTPPRL